MPAPEFKVELTNLHRPLAAASVIGELTQYSGLKVDIVFNESRTAEVTVSMHDPMIENLLPLQFALKVWYGADLVYWAKATYEENYGDGTVRIHSVDTLQMQHQYLRYGDAVLALPPKERDLGDVSVSASGLRLLRDTSNNTSSQDARNCPVLGIKDGLDSSSRSSKIRMERGQNSWECMKLIIDHVVGPDFDLRPVSDGSKNYAKMDCYDKLGVDRSSSIRFYYGVPNQPDNLTNVTHTPGQPITHAHVLSSDAKYRRTAANASASAAHGVFVSWTATDYTISDGDTSVLTAKAQSIVNAYAWPLKTLTIEMRPDAAQSFFYPVDFYQGDYVHIGAQRGFRAVNGTYRIRDVSLERPGGRGPNITRLTVVPDADALDEPEQPET